MLHSDVVVAGGGLAGSLAAAMLGRQGYKVVLVDPHPIYPPDFRCEKLDEAQLATLALTGVADGVIEASTADRGIWVARFGRVVERLPGGQRGIYYAELVKTIRSRIPPTVSFFESKISDISTGPETQVVRLASGQELSARLVVMATGLNVGLLHKIGVDREIVSHNHSISIGFDIQPKDDGTFTFPALTYYSESPRDRSAYVTIFPIGRLMRVNLFCYRDVTDPWLREFRNSPQETLFRLWPKLHAIIGDFNVTSAVRIRPVDLTTLKGYRQDGIVFIGDAFATSCPAAGTGARKVFVDVERLCNAHVPLWLATEGMQIAKIASFYDDEIKQASDTQSLSKAFALRSFSVETKLSKSALRLAKYFAHALRGLMRDLHVVSKLSVTRISRA